MREEELLERADEMTDEETDGWDDSAAEESDTDGAEGEDNDAENDGESSPPAGLKKRLNLPRLAVYARYVLPAVNGVVALVLSLLYLVKVASYGMTYEASLARLYVNTLTGARTFMIKGSEEISGWFYGFLTVGAVLGILLYLVALFLSVLAAVTAIRAFRAGHESEESNRMKVIFKVAFPNRLCLFLSEALLLVPMLFPEYFSAVGGRFMLTGGESVIFVMLNRPLIVVGALTLVTLLLALLIPRWERQKKMNMFLVWHPEDADPAKESTDEDEDENEPDLDE